MNTLWLKLAGFVVLVVVVLVAVGRFRSGGQAGQPADSAKTKGFYDQADKDRQDYPIEQPPVAQAEPQAQPVEPARPESPVPGQAAQAPMAEPEPAIPAVIYVKQLSEEDQVAAEDLMKYAVAGRSIGRLPGPSYNLAIKGCIEVIQRWPDSWYAFQARRILADLPARDREGHHITSKDTDLRPYFKQRPGTVPVKVEQAGK